MKLFIRLLVRFGADRRGAVSLITAFALPALIGTLALGTEVSYWLVKNRSLQNAADSAVIAASIDASANYLSQAKAVAARYGFVDGTGGVAVTASNAAVCPPDGKSGNDCYSVAIATTVPTYLAAVIGYVGASSIDRINGTRLSAAAFAKPSGTAHQYCVVALANDGTDPGIDARGAPKADLSGCGVASNTSENCKGHDLGAAYGDAVGTNDGCGAVQTSNVKPFIDPYAVLAAKLPGDSCPSYPQTGLPAANKWSGARTLDSVTTICGNLQLTGDVTISAPSDAVLVIRNGSLDTAGHSFTTAAGSGLAVVFTGSNDPSYQHIPTGSGALDITAPTTGTWSGIALYQDPSLTKTTVQMNNAASAPTWALTGLIYAPHANLDIRGSVGKGGSGKRCTVIVADSIVIKGTGFVLSTVECGAAGLAVPTNSAGGRGVLVG